MDATRMGRGRPTTAAVLTSVLPVVWHISRANQGQQGTSPASSVNQRTQAPLVASTAITILSTVTLPGLCNAVSLAHLAAMRKIAVPSCICLVVLADRNARPRVAAHGGRPLDSGRLITLAENANSAGVVEEQIMRAAASVVDALHPTALSLRPLGRIIGSIAGRVLGLPCLPNRCLDQIKIPVPAPAHI